MQELKLDDFECTFENDSAASYLLIKTGSSKKVETYQTEMIKSNKISYMIPLDVRQKDDKIIFYYNITSKQTLAQLLKRKRLERNEFIGILAGMTRPLLDCRNYLLSDKCFILNEDYIFINPATLDISMIYLPVKEERNISKSLRDFIIDIILNKADIDESSNDNFLQRIISHVRMEGFNLYDFEKLLAELRSRQETYEDQPFQQTGIADSAGAEAGITGYESKPENKERIRIPFDIIPGKRKETLEDGAPNKAPGRKYKTSVIVIAAASQFVILLAIVLNINFLRTINEDAATTFLAVGLIVAAIDFLLFKKLFNKKNTIETVEKPAKPSTEKKSRNKLVVNTYRTGYDEECRDEEKKPLIRINPVRKAVSEDMPADTHIETGSETVFLTQPKVTACLQSVQDGSQEQMQLSGSGLLIGRLRGQVDCIIKNNAVGKIHAEVIIRDGQYFIKDLNSKNGTYINDEKIDSNKEYQIRNKDKVTFANSDYVFITQ